MRRTIIKKVRLVRMRNITLSANENLIKRARLIASGRGRSLSDAFREWLAQFSQSAVDAQGYDSLMQSLKYVNAGGYFNRNELNKR